MVTPEAIEAAARALHQSRMARPSELAWLSLDVFTRDLWIKEATAALTAAAPFIQAEERARVIQAVHDAAELEPEERDGPHLLVEASLWITVDQLNNLHGIQDGMDWVRYTATDYTSQIQQAKAEALAQLADDFDELASRASYGASEDVMETWLEAAIRARAATIESEEA